ncbi:MAG TPA: hypothetical protein VF817_03065 [Patescibacteria group bacterium]
MRLKNRRGNGDSGLICWYCRQPLGKKIKFWAGHPVHEKCYGLCCRNLRKAKRNPMPPKKRGFFAKLFGG